MLRTLCSIAAALALPATALASLGGTVATVEADRAHTKSALVRIARVDGYTVHEMQTPAGTTVREYYGAGGVVFGVAWQGPVPPDFRQVFGKYFDQYQQAVVTARRARRSRGSMTIREQGLVVQATGHARSFSGIAYAPDLLPSGVTPGVIR